MPRHSASAPFASPSAAGGERALIEHIRLRAKEANHAASGNHPATAALVLGIGDDCAILSPPPGHELLVTTDFSLEGRHFRRDWHSSSSAGHRALARGLSDLAAMGAEPLSAFLSLALPRLPAVDPAWLDGFLDGLLALAARHGVPLAGGDTSESPSAHVLADIVLLGSAPAGTTLRRSGALPGDRLFVTGALGGSAAELRALALDPSALGNARAEDGAHPHLFPEPRLAAGKALREHGLATACIDLSDGLSTDLEHLCTASGVAALVELDALPASPLLVGVDPADRERDLLHGGEDYELLFTARPETVLPETIGGITVRPIGFILAREPGQPTVTLEAPDGSRTALEPGGWEHLR